MGTESRTYYVAVCDSCGSPWMNEDEDVILAPHPSQVVDWAKGHGDMFDYRGQLRCIHNEDCLAQLAGTEHDYTATDRSAPACVICGQLPNGHPNVPAVGQQEIPAGGAS